MRLWVNPSSITYVFLVTGVSFKGGTIHFFLCALESFREKMYLPGGSDYKLCHAFWRVGFWDDLLKRVGRFHAKRLSSRVANGKFLCGVISWRSQRKKQVFQIISRVTIIPTYLPIAEKMNQQQHQQRSSRTVIRYKAGDLLLRKTNLAGTRWFICIYAEMHHRQLLGRTLKKKKE